MHDTQDPYCYPGTEVLRNKLEIKDETELFETEKVLSMLRLLELLKKPLEGRFDFDHLCRIHFYLFQDLYDWAGEPRKMNIVKEEPALGGLSVEYTDYPDIRKRLADVLGAMRRRPWRKYDLNKLTKYFSHDLAALWKIHAFREGNTRTTIHFCCQFADDHGFPIDRQLFEQNSHYVRTALVAYNAVFSDIGDKSQKQYLEMIIRDGIERGMV